MAQTALLIPTRTGRQCQMQMVIKSAHYRAVRMTKQIISVKPLPISNNFPVLVTNVTQALYSLI